MILEPQAARRAPALAAALVLSACASCGQGDGPLGAPPDAGGPEQGSAPDAAPDAAPPAPTPVYGYRVVNRFPHDPTAFTQGLLWHDGFLYESTGQVGESSVRRVDLVSGDVLQKVDVPPPMFCEGLALVGDELIQLTWKNGVGYRWSVDTLEQRGVFDLRGEGWGLTFDGERLIRSDGTSRLVFMDPETLRPTGSVLVRDQGRAVQNLNELEWVDGRVLANVWMTDRIARIDPETGTVEAWIDLSGIIDLPPVPPTNPANVLNGIAHDPAADRLFVTGKDWPTLFEIELVPPAGD